MLFFDFPDRHHINVSSISVYSVVGTMVDGTLIKRDVNNECPSTAVIRQYSRIAFPGSKVEDGLYTCRCIISDL